jgi:hypothetical protein
MGALPRYRSGPGRVASFVLLIEVLSLWATSPAPGEDKTADAGPRAVAVAEGKSGPGRVVLLRGDRSVGADLRYQWVQNRGPTARFLDGVSKPSVRVQLPETTGPIEFLLVVTNPQGVDSAPVTIRVDPPGEDEPVADAGEPIRGTVGQLVRLDGSKSEPRGKLLIKWVPLAGPDTEPVVLEHEGPEATFTPRVAGVYRFLLIVASARAISDPDLVDVLVAPPPPPTIDQLARESLSKVDGGVASAQALGEAFEALADLMDLYRTYDDVFLGMSKRLESIVPTEPAKRAAWSERIFIPLTSRVVEGLRAEGIDLTQAGGRSVPLNKAQKAKLTSMLRSISTGFRAAGAAP